MITKGGVRSSLGEQDRVSRNAFGDFGLDRDRFWLFRFIEAVRGVARSLIDPLLRRSVDELVEVPLGVPHLLLLF